MPRDKGGPLFYTDIRVNSITIREADNVSIVRIGLAETKKFSEGYDAIFGKRQPGAGAKPKKAPKKPAGSKAKAGAKKKKKK